MDRAIDPQNLTEKRKRHFDRITLNEPSLNKLNTWLSQIEGKNNGININRNGLINWILGSLPDQLLARQLGELEEKYLDPVKQAKQALIEARAAKARGERISLKIEVDSPTAITPPKRPYKKRAQKTDDQLSFKEERALEEESDASQNTLK